jgi:CRP-like cAMP-binding protein
VSANKEPVAPIGNRLLAALPRDEDDRLLPRLELVRFPKNRILYEAGEGILCAYFPTHGMASLFAITEDGQTVDISVLLGMRESLGYQSS